MGEAEVTSRAMPYFDGLSVMEHRTYRSATEGDAVLTGSVCLLDDEVSGLIYDQICKLRRFTRVVRPDADNRRDGQVMCHARVRDASGGVR